MQIGATHFVTAYDVVDSMRQNGLQTRGPDSFHYDGIAATARRGLDHGAAATYVSTRPQPGNPN